MWRIVPQQVNGTAARGCTVSFPQAPVGRGRSGTVGTDGRQVQGRGIDHGERVAVQDHVADARGKQHQGLQLWADGPRWQFSTAPLATSTGAPVPSPQPGSGGGHAFVLNDQQVCAASCNRLPLRVALMHRHG